MAFQPQFGFPCGPCAPKPKIEVFKVKPVIVKKKKKHHPKKHDSCDQSQKPEHHHDHHEKKKKHHKKAKCVEEIEIIVINKPARHPCPFPPFPCPTPFPTPGTPLGCGVEQLINITGQLAFAQPAPTPQAIAIFIAFANAYIACRTAAGFGTAPDVVALTNAVAYLSVPTNPYDPTGRALVNTAYAALLAVAPPVPPFPCCEPCGRNW